MQIWPSTWNVRYDAVYFYLSFGLTIVLKSHLDTSYDIDVTFPSWQVEMAGKVP